MKKHMIFVALIALGSMFAQADEPTKTETVVEQSGEAMEKAVDEVNATMDEVKAIEENNAS